jgi:hypothetical protein
MKRRQRFHSIPRFFSGCVYAAEFSNGLVKVGFSRNPRTRMGTLVNQVRRQFKSEIVRYHIGADLGHDLQATRAEQDLLRRVGRIGTPLKGSCEVFRNLPFPVAANLINQLSRRQYVRSIDY